MLLAIEEMQTQIRAENGVKERIVGYVGKDWEPEPEDIDFSELSDLGFKEANFADLPDDIRDVVLAENHRMTTGEILTVDQYKKKGGESK